MKTVKTLMTISYRLDDDGKPLYEKKNKIINVPDDVADDLIMKNAAVEVTKETSFSYQEIKV